MKTLKSKIIEITGTLTSVLLKDTGIKNSYVYGSSHNSNQRYNVLVVCNKYHPLDETRRTLYHKKFDDEKEASEDYGKQIKIALKRKRGSKW